MPRSLFARLARRYGPKVDGPTRREFLKASAAVGAGLLLSGPGCATARHALGHLTAAQLLPQDLVSIEPETPLGDLVPLLLDSSQRHFPVMGRKELAGVLCHRDLALALRTPSGPALPAIRFMRQPVLVDATDPLSDVARRMEERGTDVACIMDRGEFAGFVARDALERLARLLDGAAE